MSTKQPNAIEPRERKPVKTDQRPPKDSKHSNTKSANIDHLSEARIELEICRCFCQFLARREWTSWELTQERTRAIVSAKSKMERE